jgi:acyl-coenzyme A synthetase/AMP-(fatty) acid ligase
MTVLSERISEVVSIDPDAEAIEFQGEWSTWGQLADTAAQAAELVPAPGIEVGILLRNRPVAVGMLLGVLQAGGCVVTINPGRGVQRTREDLAKLQLPVVMGGPEDLATLVPEGSRSTTAAGISLGTPLETERGSHSGGPGRPGVAVRMLTSGTTGPPKRIDLTYDTLERVLVGAGHYGSTHAQSNELRSGVAVVNSPLVHLGGLFRILTCVTDGRPFAFLEKFTVEGWLDAVRRHRPKTASLVPAALRMVLEAGPDPADLESLRTVVSGTAPLDPDDADAFTERFGVPVLVSYAATEFGGAVAGWNLKDHQEFWSTKRGSVGRAHSGTRIRVVDPSTGEEVAPDEEGLLEVQASQLGDGGWVRTTDLARMDADGFLFILGRADQAIIRGGFKVLPDDIRTALERLPEVRAACVVGIGDRRLGAVPVAAVELREGTDANEATLMEGLAHILSPYERPTRIRLVEQLPRTESGKVDLVAVTAMFDTGEDDTGEDDTEEDRRD